MVLLYSLHNTFLHYYLNSHNTGIDINIFCWFVGTYIFFHFLTYLQLEYGLHSMATSSCCWPDSSCPVLVVNCASSAWHIFAGGMRGTHSSQLLAPHRLFKEYESCLLPKKPSIEHLGKFPVTKFSEWMGLENITETIVEHSLKNGPSPMHLWHREWCCIDKIRVQTILTQSDSEELHYECKKCLEVPWPKLSWFMVFLGSQSFFTALLGSKHIELIHLLNS